MELYTLYFAGLALFNIAFAYHRNRSTKHAQADPEILSLSGAADREEARRFKYTYFGVYILVMAADWLQGPYMYTLYHDEKKIDESIVAALIAAGFIAAGVTASFAGSLADRFGRRAACLSYCIMYSLSCLAILSDDMAILFIGRVLGGLSATLLYTVFETWMIAEYHARGLNECLALGDMFSTSVTLSGVVAIVAGIVGEATVALTGTKSSPFMLAILCLVLAAGAILQYWGENYGTSGKEKARQPTGLRSTVLDPRILTLGFVTTIFEGSMMLFVFFWSPALTSARSAAGVNNLPPFGLIFSCFMSAMMTGSMFSGIIELRAERDAGRLLLSVLAMAANSLLMPVLARGESATFWSFVLFEACVGMYFPTMSRLKSEIVEDAVRGKIYTWMRMPLNLFIAVGLGVTQEGDAHRDKVFIAMGGMLLAAFFVCHRGLA